MFRVHRHQEKEKCRTSRNVKAPSKGQLWWKKGDLANKGKQFTGVIFNVIVPTLKTL